MGAEEMRVVVPGRPSRGGVEGSSSGETTTTKPKARRRPSKIATSRPGEERRARTAWEEADDRTAMSAYVERRRKQRLTNGEVILRRSAGTFAASLGFCAWCEQYSDGYYGAWVAAISSCFFMMATVLPTDTVKIRYLLMFITLKMCAVVILGVFLATRKRRQALQDSCVSRDMCAWEVWFWVYHSLASAVGGCALLKASKTLAPGEALNRGWRVVGHYFVAAAVVGLIDHLASFVTGVYALPDATGRVSSLQWNIVLTLEELALGLLCLSNRFKVWMWGKVAATASIRVCGYSVDLDPANARSPSPVPRPPRKRQTPFLHTLRSWGGTV